MSWRQEARNLVDELGIDPIPEALELLSEDLLLRPDIYDDGPEAAMQVGAELRRWALELRNR